jgi:hypothetical protein
MRHCTAETPGFEAEPADGLFELAVRPAGGDQLGLDTDLSSGFEVLALQRVEGDPRTLTPSRPA